MTVISNIQSIEKVFILNVKLCDVSVWITMILILLIKRDRCGHWRALADQQGSE